MAEERRGHVVKIGQRREVDRSRRVENFQCLRSLHRYVVQIVVEGDIDVPSPGRSAEERHGVAGAVHDHLFAAAVVRHDRVVGHRARIGQDGKIRRPARCDAAHVRDVR